MTDPQTTTRETAKQLAEKLWLNFDQDANQKTFVSQVAPILEAALNEHTAQFLREAAGRVAHT